MISLLPARNTLCAPGAVLLLCGAAAALTFDSGGAPHRLEGVPVRDRRLRRALRDSTGELSLRRMEFVLDSLGFFAPRTDTTDDLVEKITAAV